LSWFQKLYNTYENCITEVGKIIPGKLPLLPIAHTTQYAQIEVVINSKGEFLGAKPVEKDEAETIIPCTENSASRTSKPVPHPLCDKLQYVAGDFSKYVEKGKSSFDDYISQLQNWVNSEYRNEKVAAILTYLKKRTLIFDLVKNGILYCDENNKLLKKWNGKKNETPQIFKVLNSSQSEAFVRFRVNIPGDSVPQVWLDRQVWDSFTNYYLSMEGNIDLCYVKGEKVRCSDKHSSKIRYAGDKAKLISANDTDGFTFRGRFSDKEQVVSVSYEVTQKAHNALRWLIDKQGYRNGDQVVVAWGTKNEKIPPAFNDTEDILMDSIQETTGSAYTEEEFARRLNKAIAGYGCDLDTKAEVVIMCLDSATTGRLAITYYRELSGSEFLERVKNWHSSCVWRHTYKIVADGVDEKGKDKYKHITFTGAPAPIDIAFAAYGDKVSKSSDSSGNKLKKATVERLLPCIIDGARVPYDIVNSAVNRASNPVPMEKWEWEKTLSIACALIRKFQFDKNKEVWTMSLDENQMDRSYLFGRLLAIAHQIEEWALNIAGEKRETNAERYMHQFRLHPYKTWGIIVDKLRPYQSRLGNQARKYNELMTKVTSLIPFKEFTSIEPLDNSYLLGYACQRQVFIDEKNENIAKKEKNKLEHQMEN